MAKSVNFDLIQVRNEASSDTKRLGGIFKPNIKDQWDQRLSIKSPALSKISSIATESNEGRSESPS